MTLEQWTPIAALIGPGLVLVVYLAVRWVLKKRKRARLARRALLARIDKLELELSKIPENAAGAGDLQLLEAGLKEAQAAVARAQATLITREAAERIVNQLNAVTLDVAALKDWQAGLEQVEELRGALSQNAGQEKST